MDGIGNPTLIHCYSINDSKSCKNLSVVTTYDDSLLSPYSHVELLKTFKLIDKDNNVGAVSKHDLEECSRMIAAVDEDGDGFLNFNVFS